MPEDPAYAEIRALRERLARLEALATAPPEDRSNPMPIIHPADFATREERRRRSIAATFRKDPAMERLAGLSAKAEAGNPVAALELATLSPDVRLSLGFYGSARAAAVAEHLISDSTGDPR